MKTTLPVPLPLMILSVLSIFWGADEAGTGVDVGADGVEGVGLGEGVEGVAGVAVDAGILVPYHFNE